MTEQAFRAAAEKALNAIACWSSHDEDDEDERRDIHRMLFDAEAALRPFFEEPVR